MGRSLCMGITITGLKIMQGEVLGVIEEDNILIIL